MLKPERKAQWCGHDGASEFGPPGLSAAVHVWGSDPVPPYQLRLGLSSRMPLWGSNPGLPDQLWACYSHVRAPCREDRLGGLWSRSGSGHKLDRSTGATAARPRRDRKWLLAARGTACKLFLYVTRLRLCVGAAHRASQLNLSKTLLRSRMSGSPVNELSAPPRGARRYFIRSSRLATALHISASKQKCSRAAVSALQRRSDAIPHEVPCTENEVAAMGR